MKIEEVLTLTLTLYIHTLDNFNVFDGQNPLEPLLGLHNPISFAEFEFGLGF